MHQIKYPVSLIVITLLFSACTTKQIETETKTLSSFQRLQIEIAYEKSDALLAQDKPAKAAKLLWRSAGNIILPHQQLMQITATEILLNHSRPLLAYHYLLQIDDAPLVETNLLRKKIVEASFYHVTGQYKKVTTTLPSDLIQYGDDQMQIAALELTADAWAKTQNLVPAIEARLELNALINEEHQADNIKKLWHALLLSDPVSQQEITQKSYSAEVRPWIELAVLATPETIDIPNLNREFERWRRENQQWPLPDSIHEELLSRWEYLDFTPQQIAILLPLTGDYSKLGRTVQRGFSSLYSQSRSLFSVRFYNTDTEKDTMTLYQQAVNEDGADIVIGPLLKDRVVELANTEITVPTIALNYLERKPPKDSEFFQFGLLPEDEAFQIAEQMWNDNFHFVLAVTPNTPWGKRLYNTFANHYRELGGIIRDVSYYDPTFVDYSATIETLFHLDQSYKRYRDLISALGEDISFVPRIRDDVEAAVLFADSKHAALIYPQMKYHYVDKFPVYASSHIYQPKDSKKNRDLDGIRYCDAPIVFERNKATNKKLETGSEHLLRLFALGADSYQLIKLFRRMNIAHTTFNGLTGELSIGENRRFFRKLKWGTFSYGKPTLGHHFYR